VGFVATKKMTLLSGNPDGFAFDINLQSPTKRATDEQSVALKLQLSSQYQTFGAV
jgi:hypothetical protein